MLFLGGEKMPHQEDVPGGYYLAEDKLSEFILATRLQSM